MQIKKALKAMNKYSKKSNEEKINIKYIYLY